ncbi:ABC transporter substrate-binding protein [Mediterraneibacter massiliensis]|jgi:raffinose/stachyose/melibiose transport system substrate-binding protein|uniref:ABC transporter substrate-binding protein n=1 Tax=Mediterraneibacter massiliensis TaxID=1720300 RepID=UPI000E4E0666|nr:extracellular solute-binding protein [Mediterraneibacter massiliensis]RGT74939.1 extracellular solute-binding protein [Ruminococcus sp. AF18-22]
MKKISVMLAMTLLVSLIAGCGKGSDSQGAGETTLSIWYWGEQEVPGYKAYMEEMVKRYEEKKPDIKVEAVLQESDNLYTAFRTAEAASEGPDIQYMWGGTQAMEDVWKGNVAPLSDYISEEELSMIPQSSLAQTNWNGKQWGIPAYGFTYGIAYDKEAMRTAGVDPENPFTTWEEFMECCEKLKSVGITPIGMGLKDGYLPAWIGIFLGQQNLDSVNDMISLMSGRESFTDEKYAEWLDKIVELKEGGYINDDILSLDLYQGQQLIESGKAAMTLHTQPYAVSLEKSLGADKIGFAKAPVYGTGKFADSVATPSQVYVIPNSAEHKEEAADFLLFLQEEENIKCLYEMASAIMPNNNFKEEWVSSEIDKKVLTWQQEDNFCYQLYFAPMFESDGLIPVVQKMFSEDLPAVEAGKELDGALTKCIEQNPEVHEAFLEWSVEE